MKVLVQNDLTKAIRKLSKLKSLSGTISSNVKEKMIFKKGTTLRRMRLLKKNNIIRLFKSEQRKSVE